MASSFLTNAGASVLPASSDAHIHSVASLDVKIWESHAPRTLVYHRYILAVPQGWADAASPPAPTIWLSVPIHFHLLRLTVATAPS